MEMPNLLQLEWQLSGIEASFWKMMIVLVKFLPIF